MGEGSGELVSSLPLSLLTGVQWGWGAGRTKAALTLRQPGAAPLYSPPACSLPTPVWWALPHSVGSCSPGLPGDGRVATLTVLPHLPLKGMWGRMRGLPAALLAKTWCGGEGGGEMCGAWERVGPRGKHLGTTVCFCGRSVRKTSRYAFPLKRKCS